MKIRFKKRENLTIERELLQELWYALNRRALKASSLLALNHITSHQVKALDLLRALDQKELIAHIWRVK